MLIKALKSHPVVFDTIKFTKGIFLMTPFNKSKIGLAMIVLANIPIRVVPKKTVINPTPGILTGISPSINPIVMKMI